MLRMFSEWEADGYPSNAICRKCKGKICVCCLKAQTYIYQLFKEIPKQGNSGTNQHLLDFTFPPAAARTAAVSLLNEEAKFYHTQIWGSWLSNWWVCCRQDHSCSPWCVYWVERGVCNQLNIFVESKTNYTPVLLLESSTRRIQRELAGNWLKSFMV